jgi:hypothetical protein
MQLRVGHPARCAYRVCMDLLTIIGVVTGTVGAIAGVGGVATGRRANRTAKRAEVSAARVAAIEARREHADLTPVFEIAWKDLSERDSVIDVKLVGGRRASTGSTP